MGTQLKENTKYTVIQISGWLAITTKEEIAIIRFSSIHQRYIYKRKGLRKELLLPLDACSWLFFEDHDLPIKVDSDTDNFLGNARFNFVSDNPEQLRQYVLNNCISADPKLLEKIMITPERKKENRGDYSYTPLFEKEL